MKLILLLVLATGRLFLYLYDKIWGGGTICISVPRSKFCCEICPPVPPPVIYAHDYSTKHVRPLSSDVQQWRCGKFGSGAMLGSLLPLTSYPLPFPYFTL